MLVCSGGRQANGVYCNALRRTMKHQRLAIGRVSMASWTGSDFLSKAVIRRSVQALRSLGSGPSPGVKPTPTLAWLWRLWHLQTLVRDERTAAWRCRRLRCLWCRCLEETGLGRRISCFLLCRSRCSGVRTKRTAAFSCAMDRALPLAASADVVTVAMPASESCPEQGVASSPAAAAA